MQEFNSCIAISVLFFFGLCDGWGVLRCSFVLFGLWRIGAGGEKLIEPEADIYIYIYIFISLLSPQNGFRDESE